MDVIVDESGNEIIRVYEKGLAEEIVSAHNARKPKPNLTILDEKWEVECSDDEYWIQTKEDGEIIATITAINKPLRVKQIAALPDAYRVLKNAVNGYDRAKLPEDDDMMTFFRVLEKAGIE